MTMGLDPATALPPERTSPVSFGIERPAQQSRLLNFPLGIGMTIRVILLIPHLLVLAVMGLLAFVLYFIATFAILFSGKFPRGMFDFIVNVQRWSSNVNGYMFGLYDNYPKFTGSPQVDFPLAYDVDYPETSSRLLNLPLIGYYIKSLLLIPNVIVLFFVLIVAYIILFIAPFAVLFTGSFPEGMHKFLVGTQRWGARVGAYTLALTDKYPPFSMD